MNDAAVFFTALSEAVDREVDKRRRTEFCGGSYEDPEWAADQREQVIYAFVAELVVRQEE